MGKQVETGTVHALGMRVKDYMGIELADFKFGKGEVTLITGENGSGKTSVLNAFWAAIGGGKIKLKKPIRDGKATATIEVDLQTENVKVGRLTVTRRYWFKRDKETKEVTDEVTGEIKITGDGNQQYSRPQEIMDELFTELSIDPTKFDLMKPADRRELLLSMVDIGMDLDEWGRIEDGLKTKRSEAKVERDILRAKATGMEIHEDAPEAVIDPAAIQAKIDEAEVVKTQKLEMVSEAADLVRDEQDALQCIKDAEEHIEQLQATIKNQQAHAKECCDKSTSLGTDALAITVPDIESLRSERLGVSDQNRKFDDNQRTRDVRVAAEKAQGLAERAESELEDHRQAKIDSFAKAKMPVKGLEVDDKDITFEGIPWDQINSAERIQLALKLQAALNPKLRMITCQYGSLIDPAGREEIAKFSKENNFEILMEAVGTGEGSEPSVVFSDGKIVQPTAKGKVREITPAELADDEPMPVQDSLLPEENEDEA